MKYILLAFYMLTSINLVAQNLQVDSQTYTPQQLIEDILINSNCITNVTVTNVVGGNFGGTDQSYGYFDATGTTFPFQSGIVLTTGRLSNVEGPNTTLSDDDAVNWFGDNDLENILNESNTHNATIIEFEFTAVANLISFRYLFASEEYQQGNPNTCQFSDVFGFLIRETSNQNYTNIALVPDTQTPVKVTTVHPNIPNGCAAQNESYFGSWNTASAPINFNGQTAVLTATASVVPGATYHVKLVIADEQNFRYDSAVFLEAGSFQLRTDLGPNRLLATNSALCENETLQLNASQTGATSYRWFFNDVEQLGSNNSTFDVMQAGKYNVEVALNNSCFSYGEILIEYAQNPMVQNTNIIECDINQDGLTTFNLFDATQNITNGNASLSVQNFYLTDLEAQQDINQIPNPTTFQNSIPQQVVYARAENMFRCFSVAEITLDISNNVLNLPDFYICDDNVADGFSTFNINDLISHVEPLVPNGATISFYTTEQDAYNDSNALNGNYTNSTPYSETLFVKVENNGNCYATSRINLNVVFTPQLLPNESQIYCLNTFPDTIQLFAGILNDNPNNYSYQWFFNNQLISAASPIIDINEIGSYSVIATHQNGCSATRNITVVPSNAATITDVIIEETSTKNSITINVSGQGDYQFALDNQIYNDNNIFTNVNAGFRTVYVLDKNGCGTVSRTISVLGFPKYFTPNNDGINDTWKPLGVNAQFNSDITITIFNRYGKLLKNISPLKAGWDGTINGFKLPNDDYWYKVVLSNGKEYRGHFTLKR
ncbi:T9SS type B sorting domain-containing protein [Gelatiniphilus marinus]|uniref:Choice-of-anchor L domain-containing protein n=1 Tax=Gelatiniphilus marinus TaxID=1759464 RepID=A0ABW5JPZ8_9FLAO